MLEHTQLINFNENVLGKVLPKEIPNLISPLSKTQKLDYRSQRTWPNRIKYEGKIVFGT